MIDDPDLNLAMWEASSPMVAAAHVHGPLPAVSDAFLRAPLVVRQATLVVAGIARVHLGDPVQALLREVSNDVHGGDTAFWRRVAVNHVPYEEIKGGEPHERLDRQAAHRRGPPRRGDPAAKSDPAQGRADPGNVPHAMPEWAQNWVHAEAIATQTPQDLAGMCVLGVLSAAAGGRAVVQARPGWIEPCNLYLLPVMPPGTRKSAVNAAATRPLYDAEKDLVERVRAQIAETATMKDMATKAAEKALRTAANADGARRNELTADAVSAALAAEEIDVPVVPRLVADDVTAEAVGSLLAAHGGRLAIISAEGGVFETMGGRYSGGVPNLDVWLKGHAGDQLRVDRKGRPSEYVPLSGR